MGDTGVFQRQCWVTGEYLEAWETEGQAFSQGGNQRSVSEADFKLGSLQSLLALVVKRGWG